MNYLRTALVILLLAGGCSEKIDMKTRLDTLVAAEHAFAETSVEIGNRRAFLEYFAEDAILFRPQAVPARQYLLEQPDDASLLTWRPVYADISRSGDMGYTTGPWEYRASGPEDPQVIHGNYVSVWERQTDGAWKVVIDAGTSNPPPESPVTELATPDFAAAGAAPAPRGDDEQLALMNSDLVFSVTAQEKGMLDAFSIFARDDIRVFRRGSFLLSGKRAALAGLGKITERLSWDPAGARAANAGDLGYTYGQAYLLAAGDSTVTARFSYMRIWKKSAGDGWKVAVDVMNPLPQASSGQ